jgi:hypothetical protein
MDFLAVQTTIGPLAFVGRLHTGPRRPALLVVRGAFPPKEYLHDLAWHFSGANVLIVTLPGMNGAPWIETTPASLAGGLEEAIQRLMPDVPIVAFGSSTGNLLTLGLRLPNICRIVADEPFFQTKDLWPFIADSSKRLQVENRHQMVVPYLWTYFGIGPDTVENRDYRYLVDRIIVPTDVLVGEMPLLPERETAGWPSFTSDEDRALLAANPHVRLHVGPPGSGHAYSVLPAGQAAVRRLIHGALLDAAKLC